MPAVTVLRWLVISAFALAGCSANDDLPAPLIAALSPDHAMAGTSVLITGSYFCHQAEETDQDPPCTTMGAVYFGSQVAEALQYDERAITVAVPQGTGTVDVSVSVAGERSNTATFTFE